MKTITRIKEVMTYKCEVCGKEDSYDSIIELCEKQHKCNHSNTLIVKSKNPFRFVSMTLYCEDCGKDIGYLNISTLMDNLDQKGLKLLYNTFKEIK